jgi:hypothetical protein
MIAENQFLFLDFSPFGSKPKSMVLPAVSLQEMGLPI